MAKHIYRDPEPGSAGTAPMNVVGYARVSTDLQREKESIKTQIELITRFCTQQGLNLTHIYNDDGVSGTIALDQRPAGSQLLVDARAGKFEGVVVYKADRIGRDVLVNENAARSLHDELGIDLIGVSERIDLDTPIGRAMFTFQSAIGRLERENTLQRSRDATLRLAREGVWLGGIVPFGYRIEGTDRKARLRIADEVDEELGFSEADIVRMMFEMSGNLGQSCPAIAARLNAMGVPTVYIRDDRKVLRNKRKEKTRGLWRCGRVRNMLVEPIYKGVHLWGRRGSKRRPKGQKVEPIVRPMPAIVDEELWQRSRDNLSKNRVSLTNVTTREYLLRGLVTCKACGRGYAGMVLQGRKVEHCSPDELRSAEVRRGHVLRPYYRCSGTSLNRVECIDVGGKCRAVGIDGRRFESLIWSDVEAFLRNPGKILEQLEKRLTDRQDDSGSLRKALKRVEANLSEHEEQRASLYRFFRRGHMSESDLSRQLDELVEEEAALKAEQGRINDNLEKLARANRTLSGAEELLRQLNANLDADLSFESRRGILEALVDGIEVETMEEGGKRYPKITVRYRFELPTPAVMAAPTRPAGEWDEPVMAIDQVYLGIDEPDTERARIRRAVEDALKKDPLLRLDDVIELVHKQLGLSVCKASVCRYRKEMGLAPDIQQARAARAKFATPAPVSSKVARQGVNKPRSGKAGLQVSTGRPRTGG